MSSDAPRSIRRWAVTRANRITPRSATITAKAIPQVIFCDFTSTVVWNALSLVRSTSLVYRVDRAVARPAPRGSRRASFPHPALRDHGFATDGSDPLVNDARPRKRKPFRDPLKVFPANRAPLRSSAQPVVPMPVGRSGTTRPARRHCRGYRSSCSTPAAGWPAVFAATPAAHGDSGDTTSRFRAPTGQASSQSSFS